MFNFITKNKTIAGQKQKAQIQSNKNQTKTEIATTKKQPRIAKQRPKITRQVQKNYFLRTKSITR